MAWFKFGWLASKERKELIALKEENIKLKATYDELVDKNVTITQKEVTSLQVKPYKNVFYSNKNLTVIYQDGTMVSLPMVEVDIFNKVRVATTKQEIEMILFPPKAIEYEYHADEDAVKNNLEIFKDYDHFMVLGQEVFMKGIKLALPPIVLVTFIEILEKLEAYSRHDKPSLVSEDEYLYDEFSQKYEALRMFWLKLALNPLAQSREDLLKFVKVNDVRITQAGNLILYRRIVTQGKENKELVTFVSQEYYKIKKWKKSPKSYYVWQDDQGKWELRPFGKPNGIETLHGNLEDLYKDLPNMDANTYTSWHNRGEMEIRVGGIYRIEDEGINLDNGLCAAGGLHAASVSYNYGGYGDTPVVVLVNPSKAITVPTGDTGKLRTVEMFVACVNDKEAGQHFDEDSLSVFDEEYHDVAIAELEEAVSKKSFERLAVTEHSPELSLKDISNIKEMMKERVKEVV